MHQILHRLQAHYSWNDFLTAERVAELNNILQRLGESVNPCTENALRFLKTDLSKTKVVILGQDPYPQECIATGRAFEVGGLKSWQQNFRQVSLKNIVRLLHKNYCGITSYENILSFDQIRQEIKLGRFPILPPDELFDSWEAQGVLLLNTSFTCIPGVPGSHENIWASFSSELINFISNKRQLHWFLWGKRAFEKKVFIHTGVIHISRHPMLCSYKYEDDFLKSDCFLKTCHLIQWLG